MFNVAYENTMSIEGGYANDSNDRGGETYCGISRHWNPEWEGWVIVDSGKHNLKALYADQTLKGMVRRFYLTEFWEKLSGDRIGSINLAIACELFDTAVNVSRKQAIIFLQSALNMLNEKDGMVIYHPLLTDGKIGSETIWALDICIKSAFNASALILNCMNGEQYIFYKQNPQHKRYRGWFART